MLPDCVKVRTFPVPRLAFCFITEFHVKKGGLFTKNDLPTLKFVKKTLISQKLDYKNYEILF